MFWDIGANAGYHSIFVKAKVPGTQVVGFEPNPEVFFRLVENQKMNSLDCVFLPIALGVEVKAQRLHVVTKGNSGLTTLKPNSNVLYDSALDILTLSGDFIVDNSIAPAPHVIKIDVEGSELDVLKGMSQILQGSSLHTIIFEALNSEELKKITKFLKSKNFSLPIPVDHMHNFISKSYETISSKGKKY